MNHAQALRFRYDDGGRADAGFSGRTGDCVTRAIAIAEGVPYAAVYADIAARSKRERAPKRGSISHVRLGVYTRRKWFQDYMRELGWTWVSCMGIGTGCRVHLRADELPAGMLICSLSKHYCAVDNHVVRDTHNPSRSGTRCVYGYWTKNA